MKFQTLSIITGTQVCQAECPFCVSKLTCKNYVDNKPTPIDYRNFKKTLRLAQIGNVSTIIFTGKGEPFLYPYQLIAYLKCINDGNYDFPFIEIQTNGELLTHDKIGTWKVDDLLKELYELGVTSILISNIGPNPELSKQIYFPKRKDYFDMQKLVKRIQNFGINVRLTTIGIRGGIDSVQKINELVNWARILGVKQITWRPVTTPGEEEAHDAAVLAWVKDNFIEPEAIREINDEIDNNGTMIFKLVHGAAVYDYKDMNICLTNCLTLDPEEETIRQLIFYPDGSLYTDWVHKGSVLL